MAESALAVNVPEAEQYVGALRQRFDPAAKLGVPAHITVLYPFVPPERIIGSVVRKVRDILSSFEAFEFSLTRIVRFPTALYLAPEPAQPFIGLTEALVRAFPEYPPYGGQYDSIVPHLTVAQGSDAEHHMAEAELVAALPRVGIEASCREVVLIENSSGRWEHMHSFPVGRSLKI
jgi:2'-5' RNA ligase